LSDVPYGYCFRRIRFLGFGYSQKNAQKRIESGDVADAYPQLHSFSRAGRVPDLAAAQIVADHIGTIHHEIKFTIQEGLDAIRCDL
jgi:asparagine synthase (glutamine-hydrolysing)